MSASYLVEEFYQLNHRLPTQADVLSVSRDKKVIIFYRPWLTQTDLEKISPMSDVLFFEVQGDVAKFPEEALTEFGSPPAASKPTYLLIDWGFDVPKCWASWLNRSTAITDTTKFYFLGSSFADTSLFSAIAGALACAGILIWQWPKPKISGVK
ncbi:MAG: hypothetical protein K2X81_26985 [Candidatus Obscuribacterales bacterium]|nr:hypothetical protein [Candidatus Obscuribacterales bacterium]